ncbi:hypothetical protein GW765_02840 [Candidatus Parcubacteria bacterium]|nr:hypothetical protein [Candidatus Parcubacteria bacterium]
MNGEIINIYDFDGVLFKESRVVWDEVLENNCKRFQIEVEEIIRKGYFPNHLYETDGGKALYDIYKNAYFSQRMSDENVDRLSDLNEGAVGLVLTYNPSRLSMMKLIGDSNIGRFFREIVIGNRSHGPLKKDFFKAMRFAAGPDVLINFYTDTFEDLLEAQTSESNIVSYYATHEEKVSEMILGITTKERIMKPFF